MTTHREPLGPTDCHLCMSQGKEFTLSPTEKVEWAEKEVKNGRLAMMAITGMAVQEALWHTPVIAQTPWFFGR